jgi:glycerophosphoryl diester phosphodiesterase
VTLRIAHRGASRERPENTMPAFERALAQGADGIELDVHATSDGIVVVHHDPDLLSNGERIWIHRAPWSAVRQVRLSGGAHIPTLTEVLDLVGTRSRLYVEIKGRGIEQAVVQTLSAGKGEYAVHAFDHRVSRRVRTLSPALPTGVLSASYPVDPIEPVVAAGAQTLWQHCHLIDQALVDRAHAAGVAVIAWTVNDRPLAEELRALGVDGLCGDDLALLGG